MAARFQSDAVSSSSSWDQNAGGKRIRNVGYPTVTSDAANKAYVDDHLKDADGNVDVGGRKVTNLGTPTDGTDGATKAYVDSLVSGGGHGVFDNGYASVHYSFESEDDVTFVDLSVDRQVSAIEDKGHFERNASSLSGNPSLCTDAERVGGRYWLKFSGGTAKINRALLVPTVSTVFMVYKVDAFDATGSYWSAPLFGNTVSGPKLDKIISYKKNTGGREDLWIGGTTATNSPRSVIIGDHSNPWTSGYDGAARGVWHVLAVRWDTVANGGGVWMNGTKVISFTAKMTDDKGGQMYLGHFRPDGPPSLDGGIAEFLLVNDVLPDADIVRICNHFIGIYK